MPLPPELAARSLGRRRFLAGALTVGAGVVLAACDSTGSTGASGTDGAWTFTDDLGKKVSLPQRPARVAGLTDAIAALWNFGIPPVASFGYTGMAEDIQFEGKDTSSVAEVGSTYGEINLEGLAEAAPDLIVTTAYSDDPKELLYGFKDAAQLAKVEEIAPVVAIAQLGSAQQVISRMADLAAVLGADLETGQVADARADFEKASTRLGEAGESGLRLMFVAAYDTELYVAKAPDDPALNYYQSLGVDFVEPEGDDYFWETLILEQAGKYPADLIFYSLRAMPPDAMNAIPTFAELPAAKAGQVYPWKFMSMDYVNQAAWIGELADTLGAARKVTG